MISKIILFYDVYEKRNLPVYQLCIYVHMYITDILYEDYMYKKEK